MTSVAHDESPPRGGPGRRLSTFLYRHPRARLGLLLAGPVGWLVIGYLGSLFVLLLAAFWDTDPFTSEIVRTFTLDNFQTIIDTPVYRDVAWRTVRMAALVTVSCAVLAFPIAYTMARIASRAHAGSARRCGADAAVGQLPRQGVRVAHDPLRRGCAQLGPRAPRDLVRRLLDRRALARVHVPLAPVHDPADLRRARADPVVAARGVGRPRWEVAAHVLQRHAPARLSRRWSPARSSRSR